MSTPPPTHKQSPFDGCKVFSAALWQQRAMLDDRVTRWLEEMRERPGFEVVDIVVRQSSDAAYHCVSICLFFIEYAASRKRSVR